MLLLLLFGAIHCFFLCACVWSVRRWSSTTQFLTSAASLHWTCFTVFQLSHTSSTGACFLSPFTPQPLVFTPL